MNLGFFKKLYQNFNIETYWYSGWALAFAFWGIIALMGYWYIPRIFSAKLPSLPANVAELTTFYRYFISPWALVLVVLVIILYVIFILGKTSYEVGEDNKWDVRLGKDRFGDNRDED